MEPTLTVEDLIVLLGDMPAEAPVRIEGSGFVAGVSLTSDDEVVISTLDA